MDYAALKADARLDHYLSKLEATDPESLPTEIARLAYGINAYNAYTLRLVADAYPIDSIHDFGTGGRIIGFLIKRTPWDIPVARIGGRELTLNQIVHDVLRKRFKEDFGGNDAALLRWVARWAPRSVAEDLQANALTGRCRSVTMIGH